MFSKSCQGLQGCPQHDQQLSQTTGSEHRAEIWDQGLLCRTIVSFFLYGLIFLIFICTEMGYIHCLGTGLITPHLVSMHWRVGLGLSRNGQYTSTRMGRRHRLQAIGVDRTEN